MLLQSQSCSELFFFFNKKFFCSLPARYLDPATLLPYRNSVCFKFIREAYYQLLEHHGDKSNVHVANWIKWWVKNKEKNKKIKSK